MPRPALDIDLNPDCLSPGRRRQEERQQHGGYGPRRFAVEEHASQQLAARGTKERARLGWPFLVREKNILKNMMIRDVTTVLYERKHLKMVIRSVPDSLSLFLGRAG